MSNVIQLSPCRAVTGRGPTAISAMVAMQRRARGDVFWLKENAEWLGILARADPAQGEASLQIYEGFYGRLPEQLAFFPPYYRFFLSLCLDLEDLGMPGDQGAALCRAVARQGLAEAELSDLQRAEAARLLTRRGEGGDDPALDQRLRAFTARYETFAIPNKKAAYELAHIVFYLSDYGARDPALCDATLVSLTYAGMLAFLDLNADLLAEICVALRFAGAVPPPTWESLVLSQYRGVRLVAAASGAQYDGYHAFLVTGWLAQMTGRLAFREAVPKGQVMVQMPMPPDSALRAMSEVLFDLGPGRSHDWSRMRQIVLPEISDPARRIVESAENHAAFEPFFECFARASDGK